MKKIVLLGYMASGKTTMAELLSKKTKINTVDLDKLIEKTENLSINEIFNTKGELYFRKLENQILQETIKSDENLIISLGGGTPCYYNNHEFLNNENVISIYLKASVNTLYERLLIEKSERPILFDKNEDELKEFIAKHLFERNFYYNQAKYTVIVDDKNSDEIASEIHTLIK